ncbi:MAG: DUF2088 domain-containing protein [Firmicutes bacterium]|nr:DUF2088 domain-containing protein [Bacillota bacterium]
MRLSVPYGDNSLGLDLGTKEVDLSFTPVFPPAIEKDKLEDAIWRALENPVAGPSFSSLVPRGGKVALLVDNFARATPAYQILPPILSYLAEQGAKPVIFIASGALWKMSREQLEAKLGKEILESGVPIIQNEARDFDNYEFIGVTSLGTPLWVHKEFLACELRLGIGLTQVNLWGYGGGGKILLPGVCAYETIEWNHHLSAAPGSSFGHLPDDNPIRQDIEEAADIANLQMVLNVILNKDREIVDLKAGPPRAVHLASVQRYNEIYAYKIKEEAEISLAGSFPWDTLFAHACWGAVGLDGVTKEGGTMILCVPCPAGIGHVKPIKRYMPPTKDSLARALKDFYYLNVEFWDGVIWYKLLEVLTRKELVVVTEEKHLPGFAELKIKALTSLDEAFAYALEKHGADARFAYVPYAKWCVPQKE